jgi:hypothetical protein
MLAIVLTTSLVVASLLLAPSAPARAASQVPSSKTCITLNLSGHWWEFGSIPHMTVPVCYNGSHIWQNGPVTAGVTTWGAVLNDISWSGTYNNNGSWLGVGENYSATIYGGWATFTCSPRWMINANGSVFSYDRNC